MFDFDIDEISIYTPTENGEYQEKKAGFSLPFSAREMEHKNVGFNLSMGSRDSLEIYMRFFSSTQNVLEPVIRSYNRTLNYGLTEYILFGLFYGLLILVIFTNLVYFIMMRKAHYLHYVIYATSITVYLMAQNGTGFQYLWPNMPFINDYMGVITLFIGIEAMLLFTIYFLDLKNKSAKLLKIVRLAFLSRIILFILEFFYPKLLPWLIIDVLYVQFAFFSGWWLYRSGDWSAKWFVLAFTVLNIAFIVTALEHLGWVASGAHTVYALNIGIVAQFLILSVGNAESVKMTYKERNEAQKKLILEYKRNEQLKEKVNRELEQKVKERTIQLQQQKDLVEEKNKHIMASVRYAQTIQNAALPSDETLDNLFKNYFLLYLPRDIVSGDFYWSYQVDENQYLIATVDCTGHGVPGAFMSMIGINILNRIVAGGTHSPGEILAQLHNNIQSVLRQKKTGNRDGMDMALCLVDRKTKKLTYAGAKNPLLYIKDGKAVKIRASRYGIGGAEQESNLIYQEHTISFKETPVNFYIYSDGIVDQFGGPENKKFLQKRFSKLLEEQQHLSIKEQGDYLKKTILSWMKGYPQIDDIMVIGFKEK